MAPPGRRALLAAVAAVATAGCFTDGDATTTTRFDTAGDDTSAGSGTAGPDTGGPETTGDTAGDTATDAAITLRLSAADGIPEDVPVRVHPRALAAFLERGAASGDTVRTHDAAILRGRSPVLPTAAAARLSGETVEDGRYALDVSGGPRYEWIFGATPVDDPPADAEVLDVSTLAAERRSLVLEAIHDGRPRAYPETPLGTWARTEFVGGYVRYDGTVYWGREIRQTDAAFFAEEVWYVGTVTPSESGTGTVPHLHLDPLSGDARAAVDDLLAAWAKQLGPVEADVSGLDESARAALAETDTLLTHVAAFRLVLS